MALIDYLTSQLNADNTEEIEGYIAELNSLNGEQPTDEYKVKFEELQKKYVERFTTGMNTSETDEVTTDEDTTDEETVTIDDLFTEEGEE